MMNGPSWTESELAKEVSALKKRVQELERSETERKQAEESLQASEKKYRELVEAANSIILRMDTTGIITYFNEYASRFLGFSQDEIIGRNVVGTIVPITDSTGKDLERMILDIGVHPERYVNNENENVCKDGRRVWVAWTNKPILDDCKRYVEILCIGNDITDRKRAEEALEVSKSDLRTILDCVDDAVFIHYLDGKIIDVNDKMLDMYRVSREEVTSMTIVDHFSAPDNPLDALAEIWESVTRGENRVFEWKSRRPHDNSVFPVEVFLRRITLNNADAILATVHDITDRKGAEEALRESEERFRTIFESSRDAILMMNPEGKVSYWNPAAERILGYTSTDAIGRNVHELLAPERYHEAYQAGYAEFLRTGQGAALGKTLELQAIRKDGTEITVALSLSAERMKDGWNAIGILRDITEQKQAEEALKRSENLLSSIIEFLPDATFAIDLEGRIISWNRAIEEMTGFSAETMLGKGSYEYAIPFYGERHPILVDFLFSWDNDAVGKYSFIKKDGDTLYTETDVSCIRGQNRTVWAKASFLRNEKGDVIGAIQSIRDITDHKFLESQLLQAQKMEAVGTLAGGVAHDFNNILMGIQGYASLMMLDLDRHHPHYERLKLIEKQIQSASHLTRQLLGFARRGRYEIRPADMNEIIKGSSAMFGRTKKELTVHTRCEKDLWTVEVDRGQIEQVLLNLYVNAWHAMPAGGDLYLETNNVIIGESYATLYAVSPGNYVRVSVTDTGMGMKEETRKRIFDPFFTTKEMGRGTGLGLAMVYGIMKGHNGFVNVYSEPGHGTTFALYLPASEKKVLDKRPVATATVGGSETILLVDDEPTVLAVTKGILESLGYTVHGTESGPKAIAFYREMKNDIDLVILDMIMPELSGSETFDRIRELNPSVKVILSSGYSLEGQAQQIMNKGCRGFIQKPFDIAHLSRKIREVLQG